MCTYTWICMCAHEIVLVWCACLDALFFNWRRSHVGPYLLVADDADYTLTNGKLANSKTIQHNSLQKQDPSLFRETAVYTIDSILRHYTHKKDKAWVEQVLSYCFFQKQRIIMWSHSRFIEALRKVFEENLRGHLSNLEVFGLMLLRYIRCLL